MSPMHACRLLVRSAAIDWFQGASCSRRVSFVDWFA